MIGCLVAPLAGGVLAGCSSSAPDAAATDAVATAAEPGETVPRVSRPRVPAPDLRGVSAADAARIRGYRGWTVMRGRPSGDLAALGAAHRGGVKRIVVSRPAARLAPGGRQRFPYPVGTTVVKTAGPAGPPDPGRRDDQGRPGRGARRGLGLRGVPARRAVGGAGPRGRR